MSNNNTKTNGNLNEMKTYSDFKLPQLRHPMQLAFFISQHFSQGADLHVTLETIHVLFTICVEH